MCFEVSPHTSAENSIRAPDSVKSSLILAMPARRLARGDGHSHQDVLLFDVDMTPFKLCLPQFQPTRLSGGESYKLLEVVCQPSHFIEFHGRMHSINDRDTGASKVAVVNDTAHANLGVLSRDASKLYSGDDQGTKDGQRVPLCCTSVASDVLTSMPAPLDGPTHIGGKVECKHRRSVWYANSQSKVVEECRIKCIQELLIISLICVHVSP